MSEKDWSGNYYIKFGPFGQTPRQTGIITGIESPSDEVISLVKNAMDKSVAEMRARLIQQMFFSAGPSNYVPPQPPTLRQRLHRKAVAVQVYFWTIWRALRGDELDSPYEGDDY